MYDYQFSLKENKILSNKNRRYIKELYHCQTDKKVRSRTESCDGPPARGAVGEAPLERGSAQRIVPELIFLSVFTEGE